jgi:hypothetical protein
LLILELNFQRSGACGNSFCITPVYVVLFSRKSDNTVKRARIQIAEAQFFGNELCNGALA